MAAAAVSQPQVHAETSSRAQTPDSTTYLARLTVKLTPEGIAKHESIASWLNIAAKTILVASVAFAFLTAASPYFLSINFIPRLSLRLLSFAAVPCGICLSVVISGLTEALRQSVERDRLAVAKLQDVSTASEQIRQKLCELLPSNAIKIQEMAEAELDNLRPLIAYHDSIIDCWKAVVDLKKLDPKKLSWTERMKFFLRWACIHEISAAFTLAVILRPHFTGSLVNLIAYRLTSSQGKPAVHITSRFGDQKTLTVEEKTEVSNTTELTNFFVEAIDAFEETSGNA